jgi:D-alanyl-D-alanine carboxypeptidase
MGHWGKLTARTVLAVALLGALASPADARPQQAQSPPPKSFLVVDASSGTILIADNPHEPRLPASTAKIMTAVTAVERLAPDAVVTVSDLAAAQPASRINMFPGQQWRFEDAMASLMMVSANDAAYAIAETAGGSLRGFADAMGQTAARLGMKDSTFSDPAGLDDEASFEGGTRMSAYDVAIATRNALTVPELALWSALPTYEFVDPTGLTRSLTNHNKLLPGGTRSYEGATGMKTGYTDRAGHTLVATATRGGRTLIVVVLDTYDTYGWATALLDQGFAMRNEEGTGQRLPKVAVSPYRERADDRDAFLVLTRPTTTTTTTTTTAPAPADAVAAPAAETQAEPTQDAEPESTSSGAAQSDRDDEDNGSPLLSLRVLVALLVVLLVTTVALRRRAVRRRRARRLAQNQERAARMRSGGLTVVDGRYRTGMRVGPPVESHVRVHRISAPDQ